MTPRRVRAILTCKPLYSLTFCGRKRRDACLLLESLRSQEVHTCRSSAAILELRRLQQSFLGQRLKAIVNPSQAESQFARHVTLTDCRIVAQMTQKAVTGFIREHWSSIHRRNRSAARTAGRTQFIKSISLSTQSCCPGNWRSEHHGDGHEDAKSPCETATSASIVQPLNTRRNVADGEDHVNQVGPCDYAVSAGLHAY